MEIINVKVDYSKKEYISMAQDIRQRQRGLAGTRGSGKTQSEFADLLGGKYNRRYERGKKKRLRVRS
jgi:hypothetical protein